MTFGTPARANTTIVTRIYEEAFNNYKEGKKRPISYHSSIFIP